MKFYIAALLIGVGVTIQSISCHGRNPRALKLKVIKKKKGKSSKRVVKKGDLAGRDDVFMKKDFLMADDNDVVVNASSFSSVDQSNPACNEKSDCIGHGDDRSNGCWRGKCTMCMPSNPKEINEPCYCAKNGGGDSDFNIYVKIDGDYGDMWDVDPFPPWGGQYYDRCNECRNRLENDGVIATGATCDWYFALGGGVGMYKIYLDYLWKNFGPPDSGDVRRNPKDCNVGYNCKLFCGKHKGNQMHIDYNLDDLYELKVYGLDVTFGDWMNGCNKCAGNLEDAKFIESGWECRQKNPTGVFIYKLKFKAGTRY